MSGIEINAFGPFYFENSSEILCLLCDQKFCDGDKNSAIFLFHLLNEHRLIIEDFQNIHNINKYLDYWRSKFESVEISAIIPKVNNYYFLSSLIKEDKKLRKRLKLEKILEVKELEINDENFENICFICKLKILGLRKNYVLHLKNFHNFHLGNFENLVLVDELIEKLTKEFESLICIYCKKKFGNKNMLKEHMRKKQHKLINPLDVDYDKFFIVNYLIDNKGKGEENEEMIENKENSDEEFEDWVEEKKSELFFCLFCKKNEIDKYSINEHMKNSHFFDFEKEIENFDFYSKIKLVNYIRRKIKNFECIVCDSKFENFENLELHLNEEKHIKIPPINCFNQVEYFFPTYENDTFLYYFLEDFD